MADTAEVVHGMRENNMNIVKTRESDCLTIAFDCNYADADNEAALVVMRKEGDTIKVLNVFTGEKAVHLYHHLGSGR